MRTIKMTLLILLLAGCSKVEIENLNPCESFSRFRERFIWQIDSLRDTISYSHTSGSVPDVQLCGAGDIAYAEQGRQVRVIHSFDTAQVILYTDSQIIFYTPLNK